RQKRNEAMLRETRDRTFEQCAREYIASHETGWTAGSTAQWNQSLAAYVYPVIGRLPVAEVDLPLVLKVLEPIWREIPETASRVRSRVEAILGWATVRELRTGDNPARWTNHLQHLLPSPRSFHRRESFAALPYKHVAVLVKRLRAEPDVAARA